MRKVGTMKKMADKEQKNFARYLSPDEDIILVTTISPKYFRSMFLSFLLLTPLLIGIPGLLRILRKRATLRYIFTTRRVMIKEGFLSVTVTTAPFDKISHISVKQSLVERLAFNDGHIVIHTAGPTGVEMIIEHVEKPFELKNTLDSLIDRERLLMSTPPLVETKEQKKPKKDTLIQPFPKM